MELKIMKLTSIYTTVYLFFHWFPKWIKTSGQLKRRSESISNS